MKQYATGRTEAVRLPGEVGRLEDRIKQMLTITLTGVEAGLRPITIPANLYRWVLVKNNSGRRLLFFRDRGGSLNSLLGIVEPHTTDTLPIEGNLSEVFVQWAEISLPGETFLYFLTENPGLVGNFIQNVPIASIMDVRDIEWLTWGITTDSAANAPVTLTRGAVAGMRHIITGFEAIITGASPTIDIPIILRLGGAIFWKSFIGSGSARGSRVGFMDSKIATAINAGASIEAAAGGAGVVVTLNLSGYSR